MTAGDMSDNADVSLELTPSAAQVRSEDPVESLADVTEEQQAEAEAFAGSSYLWWVGGRHAE